MYSRIKQLLFNIIPYILVLIFFSYINYINLKLISEFYLPIFLLSAIAIFFKKYYFGHIFLIASQIGLIADYLINLSNADTPNMFGGFLNVFIVVIGGIIGAIIQVIRTIIRVIITKKRQL